MNIETRDLKHVSVVKITGRVDSATAPDLNQALQGLIGANRRRIVLDLQDTEYMSSAGLRVLVVMLKAARQGGGELKLAQPAQRIREVLDLAGLTPIFHIHSDVIEAVGSF